MAHAPSDSPQAMGFVAHLEPRAAYNLTAYAVSAVETVNGADDSCLGVLLFAFVDGGQKSRGYSRGSQAGYFPSAKMVHTSQVF